LTRAFVGEGFVIHDQIYDMGEPFTRCDRRDRSEEAILPGNVVFESFVHIAEPLENPASAPFNMGGIQNMLGALDGMNL
jgi:hypothetical protein